MICLRVFDFVNVSHKNARKWKFLQKHFLGITIVSRRAGTAWLHILTGPSPQTPYCMWPAFYQVSLSCSSWQRVVGALANQLPGWGEIQDCPLPCVECRGTLHLLKEWCDEVGHYSPRPKPGTSERPTSTDPLPSLHF